MQIEYVDPKDLKIAPTNVRKDEDIDPDKLNWLAQSIKKDGIRLPIVINKNNEIICGGRRYRAYILSGRTDPIPCIRKEFASPLDEIMESFVENMLQEELSLPSKVEALKKMREHGLKLEEIREHTGISSAFLSSLLRAATVPPTLQPEEEAKEKYQELEPRKRQIVRKLLETKQFSEPEQALKLIQFAEKASSKELESLRREVKEARRETQTITPPVDLNFRVKLAEEKEKLVEVRLYLEPELFNKLVLRARRENRDFKKVAIELLEAWAGYVIDLDSLKKDEIGMKRMTDVITEPDINKKA